MDAQKEKKVKNSQNLIVPDTSVLINDPWSLFQFIEGGNTVLISLTVLKELDGLKREPRVASSAKEVIRQIEQFDIDHNEKLIVEKNVDFSGLDLEKEKADYKIIASLNYALRNSAYSGFKTYKLVSRDVNMRIIARNLFKDKKNVSVEDYKQDQVEIKNAQEQMRTVSVMKYGPSKEIPYAPEFYGPLNENSGILLKLDDSSRDARLFIRKGEQLELIPNDTKLFNLSAINGDDNPNYNQLLAFRQLMDNGVSGVFIEGPAGTGKTLIATAAALEQSSSFNQRILVNPMVPLSNKDKMAALPGGVIEKISPWFLPFEQNLRFLEKANKSKMQSLAAISDTPNPRKGGQQARDQRETTLWEKYGFIAQPLDYIRGQTIAGAFIIVEESQNLSPHEMKTIMTRLGEGSKIVFCGDLSQIDLPYLSKNSSGLTYAIERMIGPDHDNKMAASVLLTKTVRSKFAAFASSVL